MNDVVDYAAAAESGALPSLEDDGDILGVPSSRTKSKTNVQRFAVLGIVVIGLALIIAGLMFYQKNRSVGQRSETNALAKLENQTKNSAVESRSIEQTKAELRRKEEEEAARLAREAAEISAAAAKQTPPATTSTAQAVPAQPKPPSATDRRLGGAVLVDAFGVTGGTPSTADRPDAQRDYQARMASIAASNGDQSGSASVSTSRSGSQGEGLGVRLQPTVFEARNAGRLSDLSYLLKKGTSIPCVLKTGIDTTLPGIVLCNVLSDVYSANGKTVLIERGASVFGEQQSSIKQGQARTFAIWQRVDNPSGVFANIDSPAADQMGYSGIPGFVDTHFFERFGGAIMMSLISDFSLGYSQRIANSGTDSSRATQTYSNTQQAAQDMATETLRNSINIPPTLVVNPGTIVNVMVARDINFKNVYELID